MIKIQAKKLFLTIIIFFILITNIPNVYADDWPGYGHDPGHTGYSPYTSPNTNNTLWEFKAEGNIYSQPVLADGKIFFRVMINSDKGWGKLYALNSTTGKEIWNYSGRNGASMAVSNGKIFFLDGYCIVGLYNNNGKKFWEYEVFITSSESTYYDKLLIANNKLFIYRPPFLIYDLQTMEYIGEIGGPSESEVDVFNFAIDAEKEILFVSYYVDAYPPYPGWYYYLEAIDIKTEKVLWKQEIFHETDFIVVSDNKVFIYDSPEMKVFFENNGSICWKRMGLVWPAIANGKVYIGYSNKVEALNLTNGETIWSSEIKDRAVTTPPTITKDGRIFIGTDLGYDTNYNQVCALNEDTGELICSFTVDGDIEIQPVVADGKLFVATTEGKLYAFGDKISNEKSDKDKNQTIPSFNLAIFILSTAIVIFIIKVKRYY